MKVCIPDSEVKVKIRSESDEVIRILKIRSERRLKNSIDSLIELLFESVTSKEEYSSTF